MKALEALIAVDRRGDVHRQVGKAVLITCRGEQKFIETCRDAAAVGDVGRVGNHDLRGRGSAAVGQIAIGIDCQPARRLQRATIGDGACRRDAEIATRIDGATACHAGSCPTGGDCRVAVGGQVAGDGQVAVGVDDKVGGACRHVALNAHADAVIIADDVDLAG